MKYLMKHTQAFFEITTANGADIWKRVRDTIVIVLATPNAWGMLEQAILRKAAITAALVTQENAGRLLQFVTEAEASVHYALAQDPCEWLKPRTVFGVIDCGGSTVDTTIYRCESTSPLGLTETCPNECVQVEFNLLDFAAMNEFYWNLHKAGGIFVDFEVEKIFKRSLKGTQFGDPVTLEIIKDAFENEVSLHRQQSATDSRSDYRQLKPKFDGTMANYDFRFGSPRDHDPSLGINKGNITLSNDELKPLFDDAVTKILESCLDSLKRQKTQVI
jgi:hypothetical protein